MSIKSWLCENRPYDAVIKRFDKPDTYFYPDPPYYGFEDYDGPNLVVSQFEFKKGKKIS
jgi:hypothetical protein